VSGSTANGEIGVAIGFVNAVLNPKAALEARRDKAERLSRSGLGN